MASAPRKPFIFPNPHLCPAHSRGGAPGSLDLPPAAGARAPPSPRPVPKLGKLFNPFRGAGVHWTQRDEDKVGGPGLRFLWKFLGLFEKEVTGRRGPFGSCQGVLLSQNRAILPQTLLSAPFPPCAHDFLIRRAPSGLAEGGTREVRVGAWKRGARRAPGCEAGKTSLLSSSPSAFDLGLPSGRGRPGSARHHPCRPGAHLTPPHLGVWVLCF